MNLQHPDFVARMDLGRELAQVNRNRYGGGGGKLMLRSVRQASFDHAYPDEESRLDYLADHAERIAREHEEWEALNAAELERFGCDLGGNESDPEACRPPGRVTMAQPTPARTRGSARQRRKPNMADMSATEFTRIVERLWGSVYASAADLGMSYRQLRRIADGETPVHPALSRLLRVMVKLKLKPSDLE